jgi:hypothetical protein
MRSSSRAALVVLSALVVLLGVVPGAKAAGVTLGWGQDGGTVSPGAKLVVCPSGSGLENGQTLLVQVLEGGTWAAKRTYTRPAGSWCFEFDAAPLVPRPGTYSFRAVSRVPSTGELVTTDAAAFTLRGDDGRIAWLDSGDFMASDDWMGAGLRLSTLSTSSRVTRLRIAHAHGQVVDLQRKSGSSWLNVTRVTAPAGGHDVTVRMTIPARAGMSTHRFVSRATAWNPTVVTGSFTVYQSAARTTSAYIAEARSYMAKYCPKTPISIDTPAVRTGAALGRASYTYGSSGSGSVLYTKIELRSAMPPDQLRSVALHECGHVVQYRSIVPGRLGEVGRQATKLWPGLGLEGQADCMSYQITRDDHWFGYVRGCSYAQLLNAAKQWQTYGGKYQAAPYRW